MSTRAKELYYLRWLPKARRALAPSGRLSELAYLLSREESQLSPEEWHRKLRAILYGRELAPPELVFRIDAFLSPSRSPTPVATQSPELPFGE